MIPSQLMKWIVESSKSQDMEENKERWMNSICAILMNTSNMAKLTRHED